MSRSDSEVAGIEMRRGYQRVVRETLRIVQADFRKRCRWQEYGRGVLLRVTKAI